jgi:hypothetical protein
MLEIVENTNKVIDPVILLTLSMYHVGKSPELNLLVFSMSKGESIIFVHSQSLKIRCANDFSMLRDLQIFDFGNHGTKSNQRLTIRLFDM